MKPNPYQNGIALSGGGSKGLAHAGALKYLEEIGYTPDILSGTSAGSIVAALYAFGLKPEEILNFFQSIYFFHWKHFTLTKPGFIDSDSFKRYFVEIFGQAKLSELKIKTLITATNMITGELKVFDEENRISDAILASSSFPGVMSPYSIDGELYSDGGILNHFPTDLLRNECNHLIGVYVSPIQSITKKDLDSIKAVTARAFDLLSAQSNLAKFQLCDWVIEPKELCKYSTFETSKQRMKEIFNIGYTTAKKSHENFLSKGKRI